MSKVAFRWLIVLSFGLPILSIVADYTFLAHLIPQELKAAMDHQFDQEMGDPSWVTLIASASGIALLLALPFQVYGLLRFRSWAPKFAIWLSVASYATMPFLGATVYSGLTATAISLSSALWGIIIFLPYMSPEVRSYFWPGRSQPLSGMKTEGYERGNGSQAPPAKP